MLYIVGTPIGNLDDISLRQAQTLALSEIILAEDTRSANTLIEGIKKRFTVSFRTDLKIVSYYKDVEFSKLPQVLEWLRNDKIVSLISESGLPLISDPGSLLVNTVIKQNIPFEVIPGPTAFAVAAMYTANQKNQILFLGFMPKSQNEIVKVLGRAKALKSIFPDSIIVCYESAMRINRALKIFINEVDWNPEITICREMTKKFEEVIRGKASDLVDRKYKGEITLVIQ